ncbi:DUF5926 family protein [Gordonia sp. (in: high G+C Gram-positive bacteria)]|uniref:DUF5926 family protein n=1 Tax=Gordonia sp. (in: high G+C Gram-positive bacteria) TaxID=84139 RepID=UPI00169E3E07|nr:DUF5926 family protein [Gordonia sp. (in: high G+C Gram-positive bacteria)]NLG46829.1 hypothetical protein [Gordonia sp. (in: high G+C Gram-positive bacteria)]
MGKKSKRGSGPRPGSNRAERVAARKARQVAALAAPVRPLAGLKAECDLVAMRAFIASATAEVPYAKSFDAAHEADFATILPGAVAAEVRRRDAAVFGEKGAAPGDADGTVTQGMVGLQTNPEPADLAGSLASALEWASNAALGDEYNGASGDGAPGDGAPGEPALTEILDADADLDIVVHTDFGWWFADDAKVSPELSMMLERANETILPTARLRPKSGVGAPWWVDAGDKAHLRWVRPEDETELMNALARVHAAGHLTLGEGSRFAGSFRTHGLIVPVFDLDVEAHHEEWIDGVDEFDARLTEALADSSELTAAERSSRAGIIGRQVTLR